MADQMRLKVLSDLRKYMSPERKARLEIIQTTPMADLTPAQVDEYNGIRWWQLNLLRLNDANTLENAFTPEGMEYNIASREQAEILKYADWRGGSEDHSPQSKIITLGD